MEQKLKLKGQQKKAIELMPDHNVQIIACAGSGKTEIVSRGISEIIKRGTRPSEVVAFTFTEKAAEELKSRIRSILLQEQPERSDIGDMYVGTIHSYCFEKLKELKPEYKSYGVLDDASRVAWLSKPHNYYDKIRLVHFEKHMDINKYSVIDRFVLTMDIIYNENIKISSIRNKSQALADSVEAYKKAINKDKYLDFSTMIDDLVVLLERDRSFRKKFQTKLKYLIVDEYQDINGLQERLIRAMVGPETKITVVGDDDQSIYNWRGAIVSNIIKFKKRFNDVKKIKIENNFRSTRGIVELANNYIRKNKRRLDKAMLAEDTEKAVYNKQDIQYKHFKNDSQQFEFILQKIKELVNADFIDKTGTPYALSYGDMAILIRTNSDIQRILPYLEKSKIDW